MFRRAALAIFVLLLPGLTWGGARTDVRNAGSFAKEARDAGTFAKGSGSAGKSGREAKTAAKSGKDARQAKRTKKRSRYAPIELYQINTKETLRLRFYDDRGMPIKRWKKRFNKFMRCHKTGTVFRMDDRLPQMLYKTGRHFEGHRLEVVSGYRSPKAARNPRSPHKEGVACDFRVAGISNAVLRDYLRKSFDHAGVGYYPNSFFIHLDNRKKGPSAFWIDYSGPGQAAEYAENPSEDLRNGRAERRRNAELAAGRAEGTDDVTQAGIVRLAPAARIHAQNDAGRAPVEIKTPQDTFGD